MSTIIVISPEYLHAVYKEILKYSFHLQGYGSFRLACEGLRKVNCGDLIGVGFLGEKLPEIGSSEHKYLCEFLRLYDCMGECKPMLFVCDSGLSGINKQIADLKSVEIYHTSISGYVTDEVIDKSLIGNLLLTVRQPYVFKQVLETQSSENAKKDFLLKYEQPIDSSVLQCLRPVLRMQTINLTMENDTISKKFASDNQTILFLLRKKMINDLFGVKDTRALKTLHEMIDSEEDNELWCLYNTLLNMEVESYEI